MKNSNNATTKELQDAANIVTGGVVSLLTGLKNLFEIILLLRAGELKQSDNPDTRGPLL